MLVPLLAGGVPDLGLDAPVVDDEGAGLELDADGGLGAEAELIAGEAGEDLRLAHRRVADQHHLEDVVHLVSGPRHASAPVAGWLASGALCSGFLGDFTRAVRRLPFVCLFSFFEQSFYCFLFLRGASIVW